MKSKTQIRGAFTLTEILVVLGIITLMGSLVMGGFNSFVGGQRRTTCTTNMAQIYRAVRLYSDDNRGFPPYNGANNTGGLWLSWATMDRLATSGNTSQLIAPNVSQLSGYARTPSILHCPADTGKRNGVDATQLYLPTNFTLNGVSYPVINREYLSYQVLDANVPTGTDADRQTYWPTRELLSGSATPSARFTRQLLPSREFTGTSRPNELLPVAPLSNTIITWCQFHRGVNPNGNSDNILFFDGSVRRLPQKQMCGSNEVKGWQRVPNGCDSSGVPLP